MSHKLRTMVVVGCLALVIGLVCAVWVLGNRSTEQTGSVSTTTVTTTTSTSKEQSSANSNSNTTSSNAKVAHYDAFSEQLFAAASSSRRVIFFYDSTHQPSVSLDSQIKQHISELPHDVYIFHMSFAENTMFAEKYGITQPGAALKFDSENRAVAVYVAPDRPTLDGFRKSLDI